MSKVTVIGAGKYGSTTTQRIAEWDIVDEVVITDIVEGLPQGLALDMNQSRPLLGYRTKVVGTNDYSDTANSDVVVITAGLPRRPGMSRMDLIEVNAKIVKEVTEEIVRYSPEAVIIVVTNPLDQMTTLAADVSGFPKNRVLGQAGMLDSARFAHFIAEAADVDILDVTAVTLGSHGDTMVPVPSLCKVGEKHLADALDAETIDQLVERTRNGGAEIVAYLKTGSAYYAPSAAAASMVRAIIEDSAEAMPVCAWMEGQYGIEGVYLGVLAKLGRNGVNEVAEVDLTESEIAALGQAAVAVAEKVADLEAIEF
ncbi:MAG: malate dehydrogenase [Actinomycetota bacterium]|nr:malate dehydrogenase [Actinomycetota bacterium]MDK1016591.1 malate dehydrogenase [Actinomycetota bacterium]MDK1026361.1 malate dehydrogenase [Actinomycetota bacterium]MDK1038791.1 malate dehydrogenase [Actinomycetota bacterium]MDK1096304.1 malate dehydrogenase [Actinomycetota bacterium]